MYSEYELREFDRLFKEFKIQIDNQFWIDCYGKIHKYIFDENEIKENIKESMSSGIVSIHFEIANQLYPNADDPEEVLLDSGWIIIGSFYGGNKINYMYNNIQYKTLIENNINIIHILNEKTNEYDRYELK